MQDNTRRRERMVRAQARRGEVHDPRVLDAMRAVRRHLFVPPARAGEAYEERPLPIGSGQTISQPLVVALMTQALEVHPGDRVLEVGTGSGYQAAVLAHLGARVVTVERVPELAASARANLSAAGAGGVEVHVGDGTLGRPDDGPFDAVVVTAGGPVVPPALLAQLVDGGRLVMPLGTRGHERLVQVTLRSGVPVRRDLGPVAFVPLVGEQGWREEPAG